MRMSGRHTQEKCIWDFCHRFLVRCPRCDTKALVEDHGPDAEPRLILVCPACALKKSRRTTAGSISYGKQPGRPVREDTMLVGAPCDPHFHAPLWLQADCCGETLWFYNPEHLQYVENYVQATLRERTVHDGCRNRTLNSRLPTWIKLAKNRQAVLKTIAKLKERF